MTENENIKGGVFALGNFDGAHRGHHKVIKTALAKAQERGLKTLVVTFEPHPRRVFLPHSPPFRLTPLPVKERLLRSWGVDDVIVLPFTMEFAQMTAKNFVENILYSHLGAHHIIAGYDFTFGHGRLGTMEKLSAWLKPHAIGVTQIAPVLDEGGLVFSSTRIRDCLVRGDMGGAAELLGRPWSISGIVIQGDRRGHSIEVPTANISLGEYLRPRFGVYAITANRTGSTQIFRGVANIGVRPTVDGESEKLEAHLFDFNADIYGEEWEFSLVRFIRPEQKFANLEALKKQIFVDIENARM